MLGSGSARQATTVVALVALVGVALAGREIGGRSRDLAALRERAADLELDTSPGGELERALERESDRGERRLALARAALTAAVADSLPGRPALAARRAATARDLAVEALVLLPGSAEAPRLVGVAVALERLARRDPALVTGIADWERPLEVARRRGPGDGAADRALAAAWLEVWPALRGPRRARAAAALREAFRDPGFFARAFSRWLELAGSLEGAAELLPDTPSSWERLTRVAIERGDLARAAALRQRYRAALARDLAARFEHATGLAAEPRAADAARREIDETIAGAAPDAALAPLVEGALAARPPGPPSAALAAAAVRWIDWARPLCLARDCPLSAAAFDRLAGAAAGRLTPEEAAFAALAAGDRARAERWARRSEALWSEAWAPYLLLAARQRLAAGDRAGARDALGRVHRAARARMPWRRLARAAGLAPEPAPPVLAALWQPTEWEWRTGTATLAFETDRPGTALRLALVAPPALPALLEVAWEGRAAAPVVVPAGAQSVRLPAPLAAGPHLARISALAGELPAFGVTALE